MPPDPTLYGSCSARVSSSHSSATGTRSASVLHAPRPDPLWLVQRARELEPLERHRHEVRVRRGPLVLPAGQRGKGRIDDHGALHAAATAAAAAAALARRSRPPSLPTPFYLIPPPSLPPPHT